MVCLLHEHKCRIRQIRVVALDGQSLLGLHPCMEQSPQQRRHHDLLLPLIYLVELQHGALAGLEQPVQGQALKIVENA